MVYDVNVLAMGAFYVAPQMGKDIVDAYLGHNLRDGYEWWPNFYEFHKLACNLLFITPMHPLKKNQSGLVFLGINITDKKLAGKIIKSYDIY